MSALGPRPVLVLAILFVSLALSGECLAQDEPEIPEESAQSERERELFSKSDDELRAEGWEVRGQDLAPGSVPCGLAAIPISLVYRGWGHRCAGDDESHVDLLIIEGVAVGLIATAVAVALASNDADALNPVWTALFNSGIVLFASSYLFDLLGTFKGSARELYANHGNRSGVTPRALLRLANDPFDLTIIAGLEIPIEYGFLWIRPEGRIEVQNASYWRVGGDLGFRVWQGERRATYLGLANETWYERFEDVGFDVLTTVPYVEFSIDVGDFLEHLSGLNFVNRIGFGYEFYAWDAVETDAAFKDQSSIFVLETELSMNVLETMQLALTYRRRPDLLVGGLAQAGRAFDAIPTPGFGVFGVELDILQESDWDFYFEVNIGTLVEFWLGFGRRF